MTVFADVTLLLFLSLSVFLCLYLSLSLSLMSILLPFSLFSRGMAQFSGGLVASMDADVVDLGFRASRAYCIVSYSLHACGHSTIADLQASMTSGRRPRSRRCWPSTSAHSYGAHLSWLCYWCFSASVIFRFPLI